MFLPSILFYFFHFFDMRLPYNETGMIYDFTPPSLIVPFLSVVGCSGAIVAIVNVNEQAENMHVPKIGVN